MPIVDGLTSVKMIRSFEKIHPHQLSARASLNGRVPIIAVSASLIEKERQTYIDAGFDGWILKPISFARLKEIMTGIVDRDVRKKNLYEPGRWESGGWFHKARRDVFAADTKPDSKAPVHSATPATVSQTSPPSGKAQSLPDIRSKNPLSGLSAGTPSAVEGFTTGAPVSSPGPMSPNEPK